MIKVTTTHVRALVSKGTLRRMSRVAGLFVHEGLVYDNLNYHYDGRSMNWPVGENGGAKFPGKPSTLVQPVVEQWVTMTVPV